MASSFFQNLYKQAREVSDAQAEAGNYKKQHRRVAGLDIAIENPAGSIRSGTDPDDNEWSIRMRNHYGYIKGTVGKDKDHLDCFVRTGLTPEAEVEHVHIVNQRDPSSGKFDEHKVMIGWDSVNDARKAYYDNYERGWKGLMSIVKMDIDRFKDWMKDKQKTRKPAPKGLGKQALDISDYEALYDSFDPAHDRQHMTAVETEAKRLAEQYAPEKTDLAILAARLHDIGLSKGRENHERQGADMIKSDPRFRKELGERDVRLLVNAIKQHRSSTGKPRSTLGRILSDADRLASADAASGLKRAYEYGKHLDPSASDDDLVLRALEHLSRKYGKGGPGQRTYFPGTQKRINEGSSIVVDLLNRKNIPGAKSLIGLEKKGIEPPKHPLEYAAIASLDEYQEIFKQGEDNVVYHGSPLNLKELRPQDTHGDPNISKAVFASPYKLIALAYLGNKWGDRDINQGGYTKKGEQKWTLEEMRPGAFDDIYRSKKGYLYSLDPAGFSRADSRGGNFEVLSRNPVKPKSKVKVRDALQALRNQDNLELKPFNPEGSSYRSAVKRMAKRVLEMDDKGFKDYLDWVGETNPELASKVREETDKLKELDLKKAASDLVRDVSLSKQPKDNVEMLVKGKRHTLEEVASLLDRINQSGKKLKDVLIRDPSDRKEYSGMSERNAMREKLREKQNKEMEKTGSELQGPAVDVDALLDEMRNPKTYAPDPAERYSVLDELRKLKKESDRRNYSAKHAIFKRLYDMNPSAFYVDSEENNGILGVTHEPTNFRFHVPRDKAPRELLTQYTL